MSIWKTPPCSFREHGFRLKAKLVASRFVPFLGAAVAGSDDNPFVLQTTGGTNSRGFGDAGAKVEDATVSGADTLDHLLEADGVAVLFETKCAADYVQQHAQFCLGEAWCKQVKDIVWDDGAVGAAKALVVKWFRHMESLVGLTPSGG